MNVNETTAEKNGDEILNASRDIAGCSTRDQKCTEDMREGSGVTDINTVTRNCQKKSLERFESRWNPNSHPRRPIVMFPKVK